MLFQRTRATARHVPGAARRADQDTASFISRLAAEGASRIKARAGRADTQTPLKELEQVPQSTTEKPQRRERQRESKARNIVTEVSKADRMNLANNEPQKEKRVQKLLGPLMEKTIGSNKQS